MVFENISFENTKWLFSKNDMSGHHIGWYFFKDDVWRFPPRKQSKLWRWYRKFNSIF